MPMPLPLPMPMPRSRPLLATLRVLCPLLLIGPLGAAPVPPVRTGVYTVTEPLDRDMVKRNANFGYTDEEIKKYFDYPQVFAYDATGLAVDRLKAPPAPGVHPRVFFSPGDLPALRQKLANSKPGKLKMDAIRAMLLKDFTGPGAKFAALYEAAAQGKEDPALLEVGVACPIIYECFRCLVDEDAAGGKKAAAALVTLAKLDAATLNAHFAKADQRPPNPKAAIQPPLRDYQESKGFTQHGLLPLGYDFAYGWMTEAQRATVRQTLALASGQMAMLCSEALPAFPANTSNWIPMHMRLLLLSCSIEGEPGYDPGTYHRAVEGYKRYLNVGTFDDGDAYESMGKNFLCSENLIPVAARGNNLLALKQVRAQIGHYYLHAMDPWGGHFTFYDSLGGRGNTTPMFDVLIQKHLFPDDPAIDFVYRNTVGENYEAFTGLVRFGHPFHLVNGLVQAIFAEDYAPKSWDQALADASAGKSHTFFSNGTGNLITRSAWTKDALQLHVLTRSVSGGHQYADRTSFSLHADGRYWAIYRPLRQVGAHYAAKNRSVILIDGQGPGMAMSRAAALQDTPDATFLTADAKTAYEWTTGGNNRFPKGGQRVPFTANDFRLHKETTLPWMDMPWSDLPYWQSSAKGAELWLPLGKVDRAFRTAGVVRGKHPYVLIIDDFQKDAEAHAYDWGMVMEDDVIQTGTKRQQDPDSFRDDVLFGEKDKSGPDSRALLLRVLQAEGRDPSATGALETYSLPNPPQPAITIHRFSLIAKTVAPSFKMLLYPHRAGGELPQTQWNADRTQLTIRWRDQHDRVTFTPAADGHTGLSIVRDGRSLLTMP